MNPPYDPRPAHPLQREDTGIKDVTGRPIGPARRRESGPT